MTATRLQDHRGFTVHCQAIGALATGDDEKLASLIDPEVFCLSVNGREMTFAEAPQYFGAWRVAAPSRNEGFGFMEHALTENYPANDVIEAIGEDTLVVRYRMTFRHSGNYHLPGGRVFRPTNRLVNVDIVDSVTVGPDGRITRWVMEFNEAALLAALESR